MSDKSVSKIVQIEFESNTFLKSFSDIWLGRSYLCILLNV
jgi:hypothetical protein